ncbi:MAG: glycoside hydrolase family 18 protein [Spirochaetales bacterium]|nr:glycoside hydrolase family 18 protein [Spirochaetales bacterium]
MDADAVTRAITTIAADDFESGTLSGGTGWSGNWTVSGTAGVLSESPQAGTYHARLSGSSTFNRNIDLTSYTNARMTLYWKTSKYTAGDKCYVKIYNPDLTVLMSINKQNDSQTYVTADLSLLTGGMATISFEQVVNEETDYLYVDSIVITGEAGSSPSPSPSDSPSPSPSDSVSPSPSPTPPPALDSKIFGYYASWSIYNARQYFPVDVPITKITHLMYAFANIAWDDATGLGDVVIGDEFADLNKRFDDYPGTNGASLYGCFQAFRHLRDLYNPGMKFIISVGGWSWSTYYSNVAYTEAARQHFAQSCADFVSTHQFDGIDINWEFPTSPSAEGTIYRTEDKHNFTLLMQEIRTAIDAQGVIDGKDYEIMISSAGYKKRIDEIEPLDLSYVVDYILVMSYEYRNQGMEVTGHNGQLYANPNDTINNDAPVYLATEANVHHGIQTYLGYGVPASKLVMGIPFFGRGYAGTDDINNGLFQAFSRTPRGSWDGTGVFSYPDVMAKSGTIYWDDLSKASYFFDGTLFISFESPAAIAAKAAYVDTYGLAGMMYWDFASDDTNTLANAIYDDLLLY